MYFVTFQNGQNAPSPPPQPPFPGLCKVKLTRNYTDGAGATVKITSARIICTRVIVQC